MRFPFIYLNFKHLFKLAITSALGLALALLAACSEGGHAEEKQPKPQEMSRRAVPVVIAPVAQKAAPVQLSAIGTVEAVSTVAIKAQVSGELKQVHFEEGQEVKKGDLLFTIDRLPFEVAMKQAQANLAKAEAQKRQAQAALARDQAQSRNAQSNLERYDSVVNRGAVAREEYDRVKTQAEASRMTVAASEAEVENAEQAIQTARAAIETAKIELGYTTIRSPLAGVVGNLMVDPGNLVKANDNPALVTINQIHPIDAAFAVPERYLAEIRRFMATGPLKVTAQLAGQDAPIEGALSFVNNQIDRETGTIRLKARFKNEDSRLWPGQFVTVRLTLTVQAQATVVPSQAVQVGQKGTFVYVVTPELTAESRPVKTGQTVGDEMVIESGLKPGEKVVIDGQLNLTPGALVQIKGTGTRE